MKNRIVVGIVVAAQVYGGPEEGGWYYSRGRCVAPELSRVFFNEVQDHDRVVAFLRAAL